jgi:thiol:disulfide interchange protein
MTLHLRVFVAVAFLSLLAGCEIGVEQSPQTNSAAGGGSFQTRAGHPQAPGAIAHGNLRFVDSYEVGLRQASTDGRPLLLFFTASWCQYCHQMAEEAFTNPQVVRLADRFVCVLVDADRTPELCQKFQVKGYPTIQFLSPGGTALGRVVGKQPGHQLMMAMQAALQNVARHESELESAAL